MSKRILCIASLLFLMSGAASAATLKAYIHSFQTSNNCSHQTFNFKDSSAYAGSNKSKLKYNWYYSDGGTDTGKSVFKTFAATGVYTVSLVVTNAADGLKDSTSATVKITLTGPNADFSFSGHLCQRAEIHFTNNSTEPAGQTPTYTWDFADGTVTSGNPGIHVFYNVGAFNVVLKDSIKNGCVSQYSQVLNIAQTPFSRQPIIIRHCQDSFVEFKAQQLQTSDTAGMHVTYTWIFQDGSTQTGPDVKEPVTNNKNNNLRLALTNHTGNCNDTINILYAAYSKPVVNFGYVPVCQDSIALFFDSTTVPFGPGENSWHWTFSDSSHINYDTTSGYQGDYPPDTFKHGFPHGGNFYVSLAVETRAGCVDSFEKKIYVNPTPTVKFNFKNTCQDSAIQFTDQSTVPPGNSIVGWIWYFGDSTPLHKAYTSTLQNPKHKYALPGYNYKVKLVVITKSGCRDSLIKNLIAYPSPTGNYAFASRCQNESISFLNNSSMSPDAKKDSLTHYFWDFGDGNTDTVANPLHAFRDSGYFNVKLVPFSAYGCTDTFSKQVYVFPLPRPSFKTVGNCERDSVSFINTTKTNYGVLNDTSYTWDFGDSIILHNITNPKHLFKYPGVFNVKLSASSLVNGMVGCSKDTIIKVTIIPGPHSSFQWFASCYNQAIPFMNNTKSKTAGRITYKWDFGDGATDTVTNPVHTYTSVKNYKAKLVSYMPSTGCIDSVTNFLAVSPLPKAYFYAKNTCNDSDVIFQDSSKLPTGYYFKSYDYDFGDGTTGSGTFVTHRYANPGTYKVKEVVTTTTNCQDSFIRIIRTYKKPTARFGYVVTCAGTPTQFTDSTSKSDSVISWNWMFSGIDSSNAENPTYTYRNSSVPTAALSVMTKYGCSDQKNISVTILQQPSPTFTVLPGCNMRPFSFQGFNTNAAASVISYNWDFGDSTGTVSGRNTTHIFDSSGTFHVILTEVSNQGCIGADTVKVLVTPLPISGFYYTGSCLGQTFYFFDTSLNENTFPVWDFGDPAQGSSNEKYPSYKYTAAGTYLVKMVAQNDVQCNADTFYLPVTVNPLPVASFAWDTACFGNPTHFYDKSSAGGGNIASRYWQFPHGLQDSDMVTMNYTFPDTFKGLEDSFKASLRVVTNFGCTDADTQQVHVIQRPRTSFYATPNPATIQHPQVQFFNTTRYADTTQYYWNFGDGFDSHETNPSHAYNDTGTYVVTLSSMSMRGCPDTMRYTLYVTPGYSIYAPNIITVNGDSLNDSWRAYGVGVIDYDVTIVDRWGQLVFHSTDINQPWKGDYRGNGIKVPEGVYAFYIKAGNFANTDFTTLKGSITVVR